MAVSLNLSGEGIVTTGLLVFDFMMVRQMTVVMFGRLTMLCSEECNGSRAALPGSWSHCI